MENETTDKGNYCIHFSTFWSFTINVSSIKQINKMSDDKKYTLTKSWIVVIAKG